MITLENVNNERDVQAMLAVESAISKECALNAWPIHTGGLCFDRYLYGNGAGDIFSYGKLIKRHGQTVGYALAYRGERRFAVRLLPDNHLFYGEAVRRTEKLFTPPEGSSAVANTGDTAFCGALSENGYQKGAEERFQAGLDLDSYEPAACDWENERIALLTEQDIPERVRFADIPTHEPITQKMYEEYFRSDGYKNARDYVIRDRATKELAGFLTWWIDPGSETALLEPVACLPRYRRRGIMKRAIRYGLRELKQQGIRYVYVSTSIHNEKSQPLYLSAGFQKIGEAHGYTKRWNQGGPKADFTK